MRIAHVTCLYVPEHQGGAAQQCHQIAVAQSHLGHAVSVFSGKLDRRLPMLEVRRSVEDGLPVTRIVTTDAFAEVDERNWRHEAVEPAFEAFLDQHRPEVVHFHSIQSLGATLIEVARRHGSRTALTMHDLWWICERQFCVDGDRKPCIPAVTPGSCACLRGTRALAERGSYLKPLLDQVDLLFSPSRHLADRLRMSGIGRSLEVDPNAVQLPAATERSRKADPAGPLRVLFVGGDAPEKGGHVLAAALQTLAAEGVAMDVDAYGIDPHSLDRRPLLKGAGARVHPPYCPDQIDSIMDSHDVLVVPSVMFESSSRAVREALARNLAVIATEVGGPQEVIRPGVNGLLVPPDDATALAAALRRLDADRDLVDRLSTAGSMEPVPTPREQAEHLLQRYQALDRRPPGPPGARRPKPPGRVLFVAGIDGSPLHYRVHQKIEQLSIRGIPSILRSYTDPRVMSDLDTVEAVVVYRSPATRELMRFIDEVHRRALPIRFDVDDLIFDPELAVELPAISHLPADERRLWIEGVKRYRAALLACGAGIASTEEIARQMRQLGVPAGVVRNGIDTPLATVSEAARRERGSRHRRAGDPFIVGYSSGTTTHDADLELVGPALRDFLRRHPEARLVLGGPLRIPPSLESVLDRIDRLPFISWEQHPGRLTTFDLNLAPLIEGVFNDSKSSIKWSEAALVDVPTLASPSAPFRESVRPGETGLLASSPDQWAERLEEAISDRERLARLGREARISAFAHGSPWVLGEHLMDLLTRAEPSRASQVRGSETTWPSEIRTTALEPAGLLPGLRSSAQQAAQTPTASLNAHHIGFALPHAAGPLARIDIRLATFGQTSRASVTLQVFDREGHGVVRLEAPAASVDDGGWTDFVLPAPLPSDEAYRAEICASGPGRLAAYLDPSGGHTVDGRERPGAVVARTFHQPPTPPFSEKVQVGVAAEVAPLSKLRWASVAVRRSIYILRSDGVTRGAGRIGRGVARRLLSRRPSA